MADNYFEIKKEEFADKVIDASQSQLIVVNFSAPQSNTCQIQEPEFEAVSKIYEGRITFVKINVEGKEELTNQWHIDGVPTLLFFRNGKEVYRIEGVVMRERLRRQIEGVLLAN